MKLSTLYGASKNGSIKQWTVWTDGSEVVVEHGKQGGKLTQKRTTSEPKNIGRANETTASEQAILEAQSKWNKQVDKDYKESVDDLVQSTLPPLAKKYQDEGHKLGAEYDALMKLNGVRCTLFHKAGKVTFQSRGGNDYPVIPEIADEFKESVWNTHPDVVIDCELYCHGMFLEDIVSAVKKTKESTKNIRAYVFDMFDPKRPEDTWESRYQFYQSFNAKEYERIQYLFATRFSDEVSMIKFHDICVKYGYEGVVLRNLSGKFVFGHRTTDFQKYKVALDAEFEVVRFDVDKNGRAVPWCRLDNKIDPTRSEFKAPLVGTNERQQEIAQNQEKYIGKYIRVKFEAYSKYGVPAKPKGHEFREVDSNGNPTE